MKMSDPTETSQTLHVSFDEPEEGTLRRTLTVPTMSGTSSGKFRCRPTPRAPPVCRVDGPVPAGSSPDDPASPRAAQQDIQDCPDDTPDPPLRRTVTLPSWTGTSMKRLLRQPTPRVPSLSLVTSPTCTSSDLAAEDRKPPVSLKVTAQTRLQVSSVELGEQSSSVQFLRPSLGYLGVGRTRTPRVPNLSLRLELLGDKSAFAIAPEPPQEKQQGEDGEGVAPRLLRGCAGSPVRAARALHMASM
eukprot:RCo029098